MLALYNTLIYQPIFNLFIGIYNFIPDVGITITLITLIIKVVLYPLTTKSLKAQQSLSELQPKMEALKKQHKGDPTTLNAETIKLYREHKVNTAGSCLPLLIQLPFLIAIYQVLRTGLAHPDFTQLYSFVHNPGLINPVSLGFIDLSRNHNIILAGLAAVAQFWQVRMLSQKRPPAAAGEGAKDEDMAAMMNKQMTFMMPAIIAYTSWQFPAGLALYWFVTTLLTGAQQLWLKKKKADSPTPPGVIEGKIV